LKFEHLVVINEPENLAVPDLSREELWFGLLYRAENPQPFLPGLESCMILSRDDGGITRELNFGSTKIRDRVSWVEMESVTFEAEKTAEHAGGTLTIRIEEPAPNQLVLRFLYRTTLAEQAGGQEEMMAEFVRSAYHQSDIDTARLIRELMLAKRLQ